MCICKCTDHLQKNISKINMNIVILVLPTQGELKKKDNLTAAKDSVQDELERLQVCVHS